jgi:hypothetical protein
MRPALTLFALPSDAAAFECAARLQHKGMPMLWLRADDGAALADALAADPSKVLRLMRLPGATVSDMPAELAGQPMDYRSMGPVSSSSSRPQRQPREWRQPEWRQPVLLSSMSGSNCPSAWTRAEGSPRWSDYWLVGQAPQLAA